MPKSDGPARYGAPPLSSRVELIEASSSRLILKIPPGGKRARSIGFFALAWIAITGVVSGVFLFAALGGAEWEGGEPPPIWVLLLFFSLFWAVGLGMGFAWLKMTYTRTLLVLEPDQLATQRHFLGRKSTRLVQLSVRSRAELKSSYTENDQPVYHVAVNGTDGKETFGTALSYDEKDWIARTMNQFLGHESFDDSSAPGYCDECGAQLLISEDKRVCPDCGLVYKTDEGTEWTDENGIAGDARNFGSVEPDLQPSDLPADSRIRVAEDQADSLHLTWPVGIPMQIRVVAGGFLSVFCTFWFGVIGTMWVMTLKDGLQPVDIAMLAFSLPFIVAGLVILAIVAFLFAGRVQIVANQQHVGGRLGVGPLGYGKKVTTNSVRSISLTRSDEDRDDSSGSRAARLAAMSGRRICMIHSTEQNLPLTMGSDENLDRHLCGLLRYQMHRMGYSLQDD